MSILGIVFRGVPALFRNRSRLTLENLALRQQIAVTPTWAWFPLRRLFDRRSTSRTWPKPRLNFLSSRAIESRASRGRLAGRAQRSTGEGRS